jgi:uncharacterized protein (DUF2062 family)
MLFKRRTAETTWERLRLWLWPRVSWRRSARYFLKRILRLSGTPYAIAMGAAIGVFTTFTPFIGFHLLITFAISWALGANLIAGVLSTSIGNPITLPVIWTATYQVGHFILNGVSRSPPPALDHDLLHRPLGDVLPLVEPMLVGSLPVGLAAGAVTFLLVHKAVSAYQTARRRRLESRRAAWPRQEESLDS